MIYNCLIRKLIRKKKDVEDHHQDLEQNHQGIHASNWLFEVKCSAISRARHLLAGGSSTRKKSRNQKTKDTHTDTKRHTHKLNKNR